MKFRRLTKSVLTVAAAAALAIPMMGAASPHPSASPTAEERAPAMADTEQTIAAGFPKCTRALNSNRTEVTAYCRDNGEAFLFQAFYRCYARSLIGVEQSEYRFSDYGAPGEKVKGTCRLANQTITEYTIIVSRG